MTKVNEEWKIADDKYKCPECDKIYCKEGIMGHIWKSHTVEGLNHNPLADPIINEIVRNKNKGKIGWAKGLTKETDPRVAKMAKTQRQKIAEGKGTGCCNPNYYTTDTFWKTVETNIKYKGGYQPRSGRGKYGIYKGYWCQSSWELAWIVYALENDIFFRRNIEAFNYVWNDKTRKYIPDFILEDGSYLEIKGYHTLRWQAKMEQFPHPLICLYEEEMKPILKYVIQKYGKNFTELYEGV